MQIFQILATTAKIITFGKTDVVSLNWISRIIRNLIESVGSVGVGIILFSLVLKAIVLPFDIYQRVSMTKQNAKMKENQAKMEKLQKQYANDKAAYNQKLMEMYKENGISMFSSCLPAILSIVIFFVAINAFNKYSQFADLNNYNALVDSYHAAVFENTAVIKDENIFTGNLTSNGYALTEDGSGAYYIVLDDAHSVAIAVQVPTGEDNRLAYFTDAEEKIAYITGADKQYFVDADKYNAAHGTELSADECAAAIAENAKENVKKVYESTVSHSMKFLWIKNIWQTDASFKHPVLKYSDFQSSVLNKFDKQSVSPYDETSYNIVTEKLGDYKTQANGYYILIVLSIGTILLQQFITMRSQKEQQKFSSADGTGAANQKMMMVVMTVMFAIFSFMYSAAFSIYMVTSNVVSMIMTLIINKAVTVAMTKQEEKKLQQKYDNRFPGRTYQSGKDEKKKK